MGRHIPQTVLLKPDTAMDTYNSSTPEAEAWGSPQDRSQPRLHSEF